MPVDDAYTKALLHFDGADASTTFTDESGKTWTARNHAQIDTAQSKFGGASGLFDGTDDYIDTPDHAEFTLGSGDFTFDLWFKINSLAHDYLMFGQADTSGNAKSTCLFYISSDNKCNGGIYSGTTSYFTTPSSAVDGNWHHYALVRYGNTLTQYVDGTASGTKDVTGITINDSDTTFSIGRQGIYNYYHFNGWIDEFRFSAGIARWTANFTPPTVAYAPGGGQFIMWQNECRLLKEKARKYWPGWSFKNGLMQPEGMTI